MADEAKGTGDAKGADGARPPWEGAAAAWAARLHGMLWDPKTRKVLGLAALLFVIVASMSAWEPNFRSGTNATNQMRNIALLGIFAIGEALVIITGGIDLSVGSVIGLTGMLLAMFVNDFSMPVSLSLAIVLAVGLGFGLTQGLLVAKLKLQPFVVTLCGLLVGRGLARIIGQDQSRGFGMGFSGLRFLVDGTILWIPVPVYILAVTAVLAWLFMGKMVWGRHLLALGRNEEAARYSGVSVDRLKIAAYTISGLLAAVAGILFALFTNTVQPSNAGKAEELNAIAAAVLGGASLRGGEGTVIGVLMGAATIKIIQNSISMLGIEDYAMDFITGAIILIAVAADEVVKRRRAAALARKVS